MLKENKKEEKLCLFYASDYHFEMISLPYINENLKKDNNIIVMTENNLNDSVNKLLSQVNIAEKEKDEIEKIDWKNNDESKLEEIKNINKDNKSTIIFVKGEENYIKSVNKDIENCAKEGKIKIIDCYDINKVYQDVNEIVKKYDKALSTSGVEKLL